MASNDFSCCSKMPNNSSRNVICIDYEPFMKDIRQSFRTQSIWDLFIMDAKRSRFYDKNGKRLSIPQVIDLLCRAASSVSNKIRITDAAMVCTQSVFCHILERMLKHMKDGLFIGETSDRTFSTCLQIQLVLKKGNLFIVLKKHMRVFRVRNDDHESETVANLFFEIDIAVNYEKKEPIVVQLDCQPTLHQK